MKLRKVLPAPDRPMAMQLLAEGYKKHEAGDLRTAEAMYWQALACDPSFPDAWSLLGIIARTCGQFTAAYVMYRRANELAPHDADHWCNIGEALGHLGRFDEALVCYEQSLAINPGGAEALSNIATIWERDEQWDKAEQALRRAMHLKPDHVAARINLTKLYLQKGEYAKALDEARIAIETAPMAEAHWNLSLCLLQHGLFDEGWAGYEHRWEIAAFRAMNRVVGGKPWDGSDPRGKTILVFAEQGFGDTIMFARYLKVLMKAGAEVKLLAQSALRSWIVSVGDELPKFGACCPLMSLPYLLHGQAWADMSVIDEPYVSVPQTERSAEWHERSQSLPGRKIGLCWAGSSAHNNDRQRSMTVDDLEPLADVPDATWVNLQLGKEDRPSFPLIDWTPDIRDFADTAAIVDGLDLVITVDTAVAHIAGALHKPCILLLPVASDWRWGLDRATTHWYPTLRLVRRVLGEPWKDVVGRVAATLVESAAEVAA
ncbi:MAG: tetratricopeptide repeat protein [Anaerolineae bacterium]|nr:tetratricopeptide repeat protein [Phycisphaerae bacterium]